MSTNESFIPREMETSMAGVAAADVPANPGRLQFALTVTAMFQNAAILMKAASATFPKLAGRGVRNIYPH